MDDEHVEPTQLEEQEAQEQRERQAGRAIRNALILVMLIVMLLVAVDYVVDRWGGAREFVVNNIECLRCHTELLEQFELATVHQPFALEHCTSCHTPHGERVKETWTGGGDYSRWEWLHRWLDRFWLEFLWRVFTNPLLVEESSVGPSGAEEFTRKGPTSELIAPLDELCWLCHGNLSPELAMAFRHDPFERGQCVSCHHPHASPNVTLLTAPVRQLCPSCHRVAPELDDPQVHDPFEALDCVGCHKPHASDWSGILVLRQKELCFSCHPGVAQLTSLRVQHEPFDQGDCTGCHKPHSAFVTPLLVERTPDLCYQCHPSLPGEFRQVSAHPLDQVGCEDCHLPHASAFDRVLHKPQPTLCFDCHPSIADLVNVAFQHDPFENDACTASCHLPHGSSYTPLLQTSDPPLCYRCHPSVRDDFGLPSAHPVPSQLRCADCHEPHASFYYPLLLTSGRALCYRCHGGIRPVFESSEHKQIECLDCHRAHGSIYQPILQDTNPELCLRCHPPYADRPHYHVTRPAYWDWNAHQPLTCSSTCHNPHGSVNYYMLRVPYGQQGVGTDNVCLLCHDGVGVWY